MPICLFGKAEHDGKSHSGRDLLAILYRRFPLRHCRQDTNNLLIEALIWGLLDGYV